MSHILNDTSRICVCFMLTIGSYMIMGFEVFLSVLQKSGGAEYRMRARISVLKQVSGSYLYPTDCCASNTLVATCSS